MRPAAVDLQLLVEVVLAPAQRGVDALRDRMLFVQQEIAAATQRCRDPVGPRVEVGEPREHAVRRVDEVEARALEL